MTTPLLSADAGWIGRGWEECSALLLAEAPGRPLTDEAGYRFQHFLIHLDQQQNLGNLSLRMEPAVGKSTQQKKVYQQVAGRVNGLVKEYRRELTVAPDVRFIGNSYRGEEAVRAAIEEWKRATQGIHQEYRRGFLKRLEHREKIIKLFALFSTVPSLLFYWTVNSDTFFPAAVTGLVAPRFLLRSIPMVEEMARDLLTVHFLPFGELDQFRRAVFSLKPGQWVYRSANVYLHQQVIQSLTQGYVPPAQGALYLQWLVDAEPRLPRDITELFRLDADQKAVVMNRFKAQPHAKLARMDLVARVHAETGELELNTFFRVSQNPTPYPKTAKEKADEKLKSLISLPVPVVGSD